MKKNFKIIKTIFILFIFLITCFTTIALAKDPIYNAKVNIRLQWSDEVLKEPIVPRDEIVSFNISIILEIKTGESFGAGLLQGYKGSEVLIDVTILEFPSWCYATLKYELVKSNLSAYAEIKNQVFLNLNENAPAYGQGYIKIRVKVDDLGFIKGDDQTFNLVFRPAYFPLIKTETPEINTVQISPDSKVVFPIKVENIGNAKTKVFFEVENIPEGWSASIRESVILGENTSSTETVYLTIIPSNYFGYHYEDAIINIKITPAFAENIEQLGNPIYGYFIVRNRGFSSSGLEFYIPIAIIILIIIFMFIRTYRKEYIKNFIKFFKTKL